MNLHRAIDQVAEIHHQLVRTSLFRELRALPVAAGGAVGLLAAPLQSVAFPDQRGPAFVVFWFGVAAVALTVSAAGVLYAYLRKTSRAGRRQTRVMAGQFVPCVVAGLALTAALVKGVDGVVPFLPGLWACLMSLGMFAARPYLPRALAWVGLFYLAAGAVLLGLAADGGPPSTWGMGLTFGVGQIGCGAVLYWNLERDGRG